MKAPIKVQLLLAILVFCTAVANAQTINFESINWGKLTEVVRLEPKIQEGQTVRWKRDDPRARDANTDTLLAMQSIRMPITGKMARVRVPVDSYEPKGKKSRVLYFPTQPYTTPGEETFAGLWFGSGKIWNVTDVFSIGYLESGRGVVSLERATASKNSIYLPQKNGEDLWLFFSDKPLKNWKY